MSDSRSAREYLALAKQPSTADRERVGQELRDQSLTVLEASAPASSSDDTVNSVELQVGTYIGSRFDCFVLISFSKYGNLCLASHSLGSQSTLPRSVDLGGILARAGWLLVPDEDITITLDEDTAADVLSTFFNMF